jgi:hypothetical protein
MAMTELIGLIGLVLSVVLLGPLAERYGVDSRESGDWRKRTD